VLGYDGYTSYWESENGQVSIYVTWLDTDRDLIFTISYESGGLEGETILTVDDVIALADTLECVE
jgi:hypoxanthine phosphoribosyltransferase